MSSKTKYSWQVSRSEMATLLHKLADAVGSGSETVDGYDLRIADNGEYKLRFHVGQEGLFDVRFTAKGTSANIARNAGDAPPCVQETGFSAAKRIMQTSFKAVSGSLNRGKLPTPESMEDFIGSSLTMCENQAEPEYAAFAALCEKLRTAYDSTDLATVTAIVQEMIAAKRECHKRLA